MLRITQFLPRRWIGVAVVLGVLGTAAFYLWIRPMQQHFATMEALALLASHQGLRKVHQLSQLQMTLTHISQQLDRPASIRGTDTVPPPRLPTMVATPAPTDEEMCGDVPGALGWRLCGTRKALHELQCGN